MRYRRILLVLLFIALCACKGPTSAVNQTTSTSAGQLDSDEIAVMAAVLDDVYARVAVGWVLVCARTATFECNPPAMTGVDVGGCSGMRGAAESPEERLAMVRRRIPEVPAEIATDLLRKSRGSVVLPDALPVPVQQVLWAPGMTTDFKFKGDPAFAACFSRVGFDSARTRALIYLTMMNWTDRSKSFGQYSYLEKQKGAWVIRENVKVWE